MDFGKPHINFQILDSKDPQLLIVADMSDYKSLQNNVSTISIKLPGSSNYQLFPFPKNKVTTYNSNTLHLSCVEQCDDQAYIDLPDGIYTILVQVSPNDLYSKQRYYLKTDVLRLEINKIYIKANIEYSTPDKDLREDLSNIEFQMATAAAFTSNGDFYRAQRSFTEAQNLVQKHTDCKNCL